MVLMSRSNLLEVSFGKDSSYVPEEKWSLAAFTAIHIGDPKIRAAKISPRLFLRTRPGQRCASTYHHQVCFRHTLLCLSELVSESR